MTDARAGRTASAEADAWVITSRMMGESRRRYFFVGVWLIYLLQTAGGVSEHSHGFAAVAGYAILVAFAACYLAATPAGWRDPGRYFWLLFGVSVVLTAIECYFAQEDALVCCTYLAVLAMATQWRGRIWVVAALTLLAGFLPLAVPSWHAGFNWSGALSVALVSLAMFGFFAIIRTNIALNAARSEIARLAAENERTRIARDLHDLLGHSLTTITVKAGLARRLSEIDADRAAVEITAVEQLARSTLGEVRAAVSGYREVTLAGELASAREVLRASGIEANLPGAVDVVSAEAHEPFGWVVRESVTNVVRHARAARCTIRVGARWIEIADDGPGSAVGTAGHGLVGLRERIAAAGGTVEAGPVADGWRVFVDLRSAVPASTGSQS